MQQCQPKSAALAWAAVALLACALSLPAAAQDHNLVMFSLDANPKPLERGCSTSLTASFLINGHLDDTLSSGAAEIRFYWADGASPVPTGTSGWNSIGTLPVTWSASDGPFAIGREWPTGFPSVAGKSLSWTVPSSGTTFHIKAEVVYTASGVSDAFPADNQMIAANVSSVAGNCPSNPCCFNTSAGMLCWIHCLDDGIYRIPEKFFPCIFKPELCERPRIPIPLCQLIDCNPCLRGLSCPPDPWDILIRWPEEVMRVELLWKDEIFAESEPLRRPIEIDGEVFHQILRVEPREEFREGLEYKVLMQPGPEAEKGEIYPLKMRALNKEQLERYGKGYRQ